MLENDNTLSTDKAGASKIALRGTGVIVILFLLLMVGAILAIGTGALQLPPLKVIAILLEPLGVTLKHMGTEQESAVLWGIRLPRVVLAVLVGGTLAVSGAMMQGLFRNPLAEPGLVGVSAGASLAAATFMVLGAPLTKHLSDDFALYGLPIAAFVGAIGCAVIIHRASMVSGRTSVSTMLLAGIAFNALGFAGLGILQYLADDNQLRSLTFWMMGSLGGATWDSLTVIGPLLLLPILLAPFLARGLNVLQLGEAEANYLGLDVENLKRLSIGLVALGVGAAVSISGMIGFIGLVVPHLIRLGSTPDHRVLLPASALLGALLLVGADLLSRTVVIPAEMPVGIVTTLVGAPFFLGLLLAGRRSLRL